MEVGNAVKRRAYRLPELREMFGGVSKASIYRWMKKEGFPEPVKVGQLAFWSIKSVDLWCEGRNL